MLRALALIIVSAIGVLVMPVPAQAQTRHALVIGNSDYRHDTVLPNARHDAQDMAAQLAGLGFAVTELHDLDLSAMTRALRDFARAASGAEDALIFFAGHGMELGGENYLLPVDAELASDIDLAYEGVSLSQMQQAVSGAAGLRLIILDACRTNPFAARMARRDPGRSVGRGLGRVEPSGGLLVAYAARAGEVAADGTGRNSPFTAALLEALDQPGLELGLLFRNVRDRVLQSTAQRQEPFTYGSLPASAIYLHPPRDHNAPVEFDPCQQGRNDWALVSHSADRTLLGAFATQYRDCPLLVALAHSRIDTLRQAPAPPPPPPPPPPPEPPAPQTQGNVAHLPSDLSRIGSYWDHNGSRMGLVADGTARRFLYVIPRQALVERGVTRGTVLFEGHRIGNRYEGTARIFRGGVCGSFTYTVSGPVSADQRGVTMHGQAPRVDANCRVIGWRDDTLVFTLE